MRVLKTFAVSLVLLLGIGLNASAQNREVSGKVLDANQQPLVGAAVMLPGTTTGAVWTMVVSLSCCPQVMSQWKCPHSAI